MACPLLLAVIHYCAPCSSVLCLVPLFIARFIVWHFLLHLLTTFHAVSHSDLGPTTIVSPLLSPMWQIQLSFHLLSPAIWPVSSTPLTMWKGVVTHLCLSAPTMLIYPAWVNLLSPCLPRQCVPWSFCSPIPSSILGHCSPYVASGLYVISCFFDS